MLRSSIAASWQRAAGKRASLGTWRAAALSFSLDGDGVARVLVCVISFSALPIARRHCVGLVGSANHRVSQFWFCCNISISPSMHSPPLQLALVPLFASVRSAFFRFLSAGSVETTPHAWSARDGRHIPRFRGLLVVLSHVELWSPSSEGASKPLYAGARHAHTVIGLTAPCARLMGVGLPSSVSGRPAHLRLPLTFGSARVWPSDIASGNSEEQNDLGGASGYPTVIFGRAHRRASHAFHLVPPLLVVFSPFASGPRLRWRGSIGEHRSWDRGVACASGSASWAAAARSRARRRRQRHQPAAPSASPQTERTRSPPPSRPIVRRGALAATVAQIASPGRHEATFQLRRGDTDEARHPAATPARTPRTGAALKLGAWVGLLATSLRLQARDLRRWAIREKKD